MLQVYTICENLNFLIVGVKVLMGENVKRCFWKEEFWN